MNLFSTGIAASLIANEGLFLAINIDAHPIDAMIGPTGKVRFYDIKPKKQALEFNGFNGFS